MMKWRGTTCHAELTVCIAKPESARARLPRRLALSSNRYAAGDPSFIKEAETADTIVGR